MAQSKAASGGAALDSPPGFHEVGTFVRDGASGTYEVWGDLRALRSTASHTLGGNTFTNGFDGRTSWAVGPDGSVRQSDSSEALAEARLGTYLTIGGYFYPERFPARFEYAGRKQADGADYDVVTVTPADAPSIDLWLDAETHRLLRITGTVGTTSFSGVVKRYQIVDGVWIGFSLEQSEGEHQLTNELTSFVFQAVPPAKFSPPSSGTRFSRLTPAGR